MGTTRHTHWVRRLTLAVAVAFLAAVSFGREAPQWVVEARAADELAERGSFANAESRYREALRLVKQVDNEGEQTATLLNNLAKLYRDWGRYNDADPLYRKAHALLQAKLGPTHVKIARVLNNMAVLRGYQGRLGEAERLSRRALELLESATAGAESAELADPLGYLAQIYVAQGRLAEAEEFGRRALALLEKSLGPADPKVAIQRNTLAAIYDARKRHAEAEQQYRLALTAVEAALGPEHPQTILIRSNLAVSYTAAGRYAEAEPLLVRAIESGRSMLGPDHPELARRLTAYSVLLRKTDRKKEAQKVEALARAIEEGRSAEDWGRHTVDFRSLQE